MVVGCTANPPHRGHLHCLQQAYTKALELGYDVEFSTVAIAPMGYVRNKMDRKGRSNWVMDDATRLQVLELTASAMDRDKTFRFQAPTKSYGR